MQLKQTCCLKEQGGKKYYGYPTLESFDCADALVSEGGAAWKRVESDQCPAFKQNRSSYCDRERMIVIGAGKQCPGEENKKGDLKTYGRLEGEGTRGKGVLNHCRIINPRKLEPEFCYSHEQGKFRKGNNCELSEKNCTLTVLQEEEHSYLRDLRVYMNRTLAKRKDIDTSFLSDKGFIYSFAALFNPRFDFRYNFLRRIITRNRATLKQNRGEKDDWIFQLIVFLKHEADRIDNKSEPNVPNALDIICMPPELFTDTEGAGKIMVKYNDKGIALLGVNGFADRRTPEVTKQLSSVAKKRFAVFYHDLYELSKLKKQWFNIENEVLSFDGYQAGYQYLAVRGEARVWAAHFRLILKANLMHFLKDIGVDDFVKLTDENPIMASYVNMLMHSVDTTTVDDLYYNILRTMITAKSEGYSFKNWTIAILICMKLFPNTRICSECLNTNGAPMTETDFDGFFKDLYEHIIPMIAPGWVVTIDRLVATLPL